MCLEQMRFKEGDMLRVQYIELLRCEQLVEDGSVIDGGRGATAAENAVRTR